MKFLCYLIVSMMIGVASGCSEKEKSVPEVQNATVYPDQEGWNSILTATQNGQVAAIIRYGHMQRFNPQKTVYFTERVEVDFFDDKGKHTSRLTSNKARLDEKSNIVEAYENVVVLSDSGISLRTEKIWWDNGMEKVLSDQFVTITTADNDTLYGVGFESDQTLSNWLIKNPRGKTDKKIRLDFVKTKHTQHDTVRADSTK